MGLIKCLLYFVYSKMDILMVKFIEIMNILEHNFKEIFLFTISKQSNMICGLTQIKDLS